MREEDVNGMRELNRQLEIKRADRQEEYKKKGEQNKMLMQTCLPTRWSNTPPEQLVRNPFSDVALDKNISNHNHSLGDINKSKCLPFPFARLSIRYLLKIVDRQSLGQVEGGQLVQGREVAGV